MKRSMIAFLGLVMLLSVGALMAQSASYVSGTVVSSTSSTLVIRTDSGEEMTFDVDSATVRPSSMGVGSRIDVEYRSVDGANHASQVRLVGSSATPADPLTNSPTRMDNDKDDYNENHKLPQTATPIVPVGLTGLAALGAAFGLMYLGRRKVSASARH